MTSDSKSQASNKRPPPQIGSRGHLILSVALPRLARNVDRILARLGRVDSSDMRAFGNEISSIPGVEGLAAVASLTKQDRFRILDEFDLTKLQRTALARLFSRIGDVNDNESPAAALIQMYPEECAVAANLDQDPIGSKQVETVEALDKKEAPVIDSLAASLSDHVDARNRSIGASLNHIIKTLSETTRSTLPAISLLGGGCFEFMMQMVSGLDDEAWSRVRRELEQFGLLRESGQLLHLHPDMDAWADNQFSEMLLGFTESTVGKTRTGHPSGVNREGVGLVTNGATTSNDVINRYLGVIQSFCVTFDERVRSPESNTALTMMGACETVARRAVDRAAAVGHLDQALFIADSLKTYLELRGRASEGTELIIALHASIGDAGKLPSQLPIYGPSGPDAGSDELTEVVARVIREGAWASAPRDAESAVISLEQLLRHLEAVRSWDARFERAAANVMLGRVLYGILRRPSNAIEPLTQAAALFEELEGSEGLDGTNRAVILSDLANAFMTLGEFEKAHAMAEEGLVLDRKRGDDSAIARDLTRIGQIRHEAGRISEAEASYREALSIAARAGDEQITGVIWQWLGNLELNRNRPDAAAKSLQLALEKFERAENLIGSMEVLNALGTVEQQRGNTDDAMRRYSQSLELAQRLGHIEGQAVARSNRAICYSHQATSARDIDASRRLLAEAIVEERESLALKEKLGSPVSIAITHNNLAGSLRMAGQLEEAARHAHQALEIRTRLNDPRIASTLGILEAIAADRGDLGAVADYRRRKEEALTATRLRAGTPLLPSEIVTALLQIAIIARQQGDSLISAMTAAGAGEDVFEAVRQSEPWLLDHLLAIASSGPRPESEVPAVHRDIIDAVWRAVNS